MGHVLYRAGKIGVNPSTHGSIHGSPQSARFIQWHGRFDRGWANPQWEHDCGFNQFNCSNFEKRVNPGGGGMLIPASKLNKMK